ncbi:DUF4401 domain-containing protein [Sphingomonas sp. 37zxx]|uniref:DUF4401 domain-containing protein n=1 Tax=Sphingomonas sp. 37zxx TaxID=1550073 RepID=UPI00053BF662|nr:DUF4401 domain-containing protein [Sphingomonas sp. 37zxx]
MNAAELWIQLSADGLVEGAQPDPEPSGSPWFVRVMLGIAGWIGALFLLIFVGLTLSSIIDDAASSLIAGAACCAGAFALFRGFDGQDFAEQFALALGLTGQALLVVGLAHLFKAGNAGLYLAVAAAEATLVLVIPHFLHRLLATGGAALAVALAFNQLAFQGLAAPLLCVALAAIWLNPARWATSGRLWRPIGYGLVLALLLTETFRLFGTENLFGRARETGWMALHVPLVGRGLTGAVLIWVAAVLSIREGFAPNSRIVLLAVGAASLMAILCMMAPGLGSALLIVLLGFAAGNRLLIAFGILSLLGFAGHFYYSLHATLLAKSGILAVTGFGLLAASLFLRRSADRLEQPRNA